MTRRSVLRIPQYLSSAKSCFSYPEGLGISRKEFSNWDWGRKACQGQLYTAARPESASLLRPARFLEGQKYCLNQSRQLFGEGAPANHHHERKLLGYTQEQLYNVVSDVQNYKEFVPWCQRSIVTLEKPPDFLEAELEVGFKMFVERYSSQVYLTAPSKVLSKVSDSTLFDHLDTTWEFKRGPTATTTWLSFDLDFAFKSPLYRQIANIFFDEVVKRMMSAFEGRCKTLYGDSSLQQKKKVHA